MKAKTSLLNFYFKFPIIIDLIVSALLVVMIHLLKCFNYLNLQIDESIKDIASSLGLACVTIAGFILTILTIVVTFKNSRDENILSAEEEGIEESNDNIKVFYSSQLYFKSVRLMRQGVSVLIIVFIALFSFRIFQKCFTINEIWYGVIAGAIVTILTFLRCSLVLKLIISLQRGYPKKK